MAAVVATAVPDTAVPDTAVSDTAVSDRRSSALGPPDLDDRAEWSPSPDRPPLAGLAYADASTHLPATDPGGAPYRTCTSDYRQIDWEAEPGAIVAAHRRASAGPCSTEAWYRRTAFQNAILGFMVLVGEASLAEALPTADDSEAMVASLRRQGFDRLVSMEISDSGPCEGGGVQVAMFTLRTRPSGRDRFDGAVAGSALDGLEALLGGAEAAGATVERGETKTVVTGGGAACATAIVHAGRVFGWLTTSDRGRLDGVLAELDHAPGPAPGPALGSVRPPGSAPPGRPGEPPWHSPPPAVERA